MHVSVGQPSSVGTQVEVTQAELNKVSVQLERQRGAGGVGCRVSNERQVFHQNPLVTPRRARWLRFRFPSHVWPGTTRDHRRCSGKARLHASTPHSCRCVDASCQTVRASGAELASLASRLKRGPTLDTATAARHAQTQNAANGRFQLAGETNWCYCRYKTHRQVCVW